MKNLLFILSISFFLLSCSGLKPATSNLNEEGQLSGAPAKSIDNIPTNAPYYPKTTPPNKIKPQQNYNHSFNYPASVIENYSSLQFKFAILTDAPIEEMNNEKLLIFMEEWYGTKYHYGGDSKDGIDCSAFASLLMSSVYGINNLPRISKDQYLATKRISKKLLRQGDLVFFHTYGRKKKTVTHVGVYICNDKFIHASISGVLISDLHDGYYSKHYVGGGRVVND